jgi:hypothetical protein
LKREFSLAEIAEVIGSNEVLLRQWINRGLATGLGSKRPNRSPQRERKPGKHGGFSFFTLMEFAVVTRLSPHMPSLEKTFEAAARYAHIGSFDRLPALPFHYDHGETFLCIREHEADVVIGETSLDGLSNKFDVLSPTGVDHPMVVLKASELFRQLCGPLGYNEHGNDYRNVLDRAYGDLSKIDRAKS